MLIFDMSVPITMLRFFSLFSGAFCMYVDQLNFPKFLSCIGLVYFLQHFFAQIYLLWIFFWLLPMFHIHTYRSHRW